MESAIEKGKIINKKIPEVLDYSSQHKKEMKKLIKLNYIFSEFENKASKDLNFYIDESNRRYSKSKCGIKLSGLISSTRKACLEESKKILNDNLYNNNKIIQFEKEKMKHNNNKILYKNLKNSMNIVRNPEIFKNNISEAGTDRKNNKEFPLLNNKRNLLLNKSYNNKNKINIKYNFNYDKRNSRKNEKILDDILNEEQKLIFKSIDNYKSNLNKLKDNIDENNISVINKRKKTNFHKKLNLFLPNLKCINYHARKVVPKNNDRDDPAKKADIHKLLPFSKLGQKNTENSYIEETKKEKKNSKLLPYITEPNFPEAKQYYKDYQDTISVVIDTANKELFVNKSYDKKRIDVENVLKVDDIPNVLLYDELAYQKSNNIKEERRKKNYIISKQQNYLKLTNQQRMNLDIEKNLNLIKSVEDGLYKNENKKNE